MKAKSENREARIKHPGRVTESVEEEILQARRKAKQAYLRARNKPNKKTWREYRSAVLNFFQEVWIYIEEETDEEYEILNELREEMYDWDDEEVTRSDMDRWVDYWFRLDRALYETGIRDVFQQVHQ